MLDNLNLNGSSWAGLMVCPGNISFAVTLTFLSTSGSQYLGSFAATGTLSVKGSFTATRTGDTVALQGTSGQGDWATLFCSAGLAAIDGTGGEDQFALTGFVARTPGGPTIGVLILFSLVIKPLQIPAWDSLQIL